MHILTPPILHFPISWVQKTFHVQLQEYSSFFSGKKEKKKI